MPKKQAQPTAYEVLGVEPTASEADIRRAYLRAAVQLHPDKNPGDAAAVARFQSLQRVYAVLSDPGKRRAYDRTGSLDEGEAPLAAARPDGAPPLSEADIEAFASRYRGSPGERAELLQLYARFGGDMDRVFQWLVCSDPDVDSHRFMDAVAAAAAAGEVARTKAFDRWAKKVAARPRPADPLAPRRAGAEPAGGVVELAARMRAGRAAGFDDMIARLEAKYVAKGGAAGGGGKAKGGAKRKGGGEGAAAEGGGKQQKKRK